VPSGKVISGDFDGCGVCASLARLAPAPTANATRPHKNDRRSMKASFFASNIQNLSEKSDR
jgi:hypothetical protein